MKISLPSSMEAVKSPALLSRQTTLSSALNAWRFSVIVGSIFCLGLMLAVALQPFFPAGDLTRDPAAIALHPPYFGMISNLGILLWSASAAVCFLSGMLLKVLQPQRRDLRFFFTFFAMLNTALCLDDTFLLHEAILPNRLPFISIPEPVIMIAYGLVLLVAVVSFRKLLLKNQPLLFGLIVLLSAIAIGMDQLLPPNQLSANTVFLIEDGIKLLAIFLWLAYFVRASICFVAQPQLEQAALAAVPLVASGSAFPISSPAFTASARESHH